ncbi:MAG: ubiquitin carboxyl-terminal hydrolase [Epsilonproteobacteria bacterium]|nr:ubiquitin carboxyl-terminal hydrolase [Campylobacterota bacterium]
MRQILKSTFCLLLCINLAQQSRAEDSALQATTVCMSAASMLTGTAANYMQLENKESAYGIDAVTLNCMHAIAQITVDCIQAHNHYHLSKQLNQKHSTFQLMLDIIPRIAWAGQTGYELATNLSKLLADKKDLRARQALKNNDVAQNVYICLPLAVGASNIAQTIIQSDDPASLRSALMAQHTQTVLRIAQQLLKNHGSLDTQRYWFYALVSEMILLCYQLNQGDGEDEQDGQGSNGSGSRNGSGSGKGHPPLERYVTFTNLGAQEGALSNLGNTCYMNSTLQVLLRGIPQLANTLPMEGGITEDVRRRFESGELKFKGKELRDFLKQFKLHAVMRNLAQALRENKDTSLEIKLFNTLLFNNEGCWIREYSQEDAGCFLNYLDNLDENYRHTSKPDVKKTQLENVLHINFTDKRTGIGICDENKNIIAKCEHSSISNEQSISLPLSFPPEIENDPNKADTPAKTLKELVDFYQTPEDLGGAESWYCEQCKNYVNARKKITLTKVSDHVLIQLKRFGFDKETKHSTKIENPVTQLQKLMLVGHEYEPVGVVQHSGSLGGGHYTALIKEGDIWYHCNDGSKSVCENIDEILQTGRNGSFTPYFILYRKKG